MFFEEKLPELKEEFGLKKYVEVNQEPGDIIFVPPGIPSIFFLIFDDNETLHYDMYHLSSTNLRC